MSTNTRWQQGVKRICLNGITCRGTLQVKKKVKNCNVRRSFSLLLDLILFIMYMNVSTNIVSLRQMP